MSQDALGLAGDFVRGWGALLVVTGTHPRTEATVRLGFRLGYLYLSEALSTYGVLLSCPLNSEPEPNIVFLLFQKRRIVHGTASFSR